MRTILIIAAFLALAFSASAQHSDELESDKIYTYVDVMPQFPGGETEMQKHVQRNIRYPAEAQRAGIEGLVVVSFVVSKTGQISEIQVLKGLGAGTDEEAVRVIKSMPTWKPGKKDGKEVNCRFTLPQIFKLPIE